MTASGYNGSITCPSSFTDFCAVKTCPNKCHGNGICNNGICICARGYEPATFCETYTCHINCTSCTGPLEIECIKIFVLII